jgi:phage terminase large subunit-like protein
MAADTAQRLTNDGHMMVAHGQGYLDMSPPAKRFEGHVYDRTLIHQNDPLTSWNMACCTIKTDEAGNIKPVKPDRLASSRRIDGIVASIMAFGAHIKNPRKVSVYQRRAEQEAAERLAQKSTLQN